MYLSKSLIDGLKILGFDKQTIKTISKEKSLEEIFLSTLFLNYLIVLIIFMLSSISGGIRIEDRAVNMPILYGLLMIYPFAFNLIVYVVYSAFGLFAEIVNPKNKIKPLLSVGYHTAIVYSIIFYIIGFAATFSPSYALFLTTGFLFYFIYAMLVNVHNIYNLSVNQSLIVVMLPFVLISILAVVLYTIFPNNLF